MTVLQIYDDAAILNSNKNSFHSPHPSPTEGKFLKELAQKNAHN